MYRPEPYYAEYARKFPGVGRKLLRCLLLGSETEGASRYGICFCLKRMDRRLSFSFNAFWTEGYLSRNLAKVSRDTQKCLHISVMDLSPFSMWMIMSRLCTRMIILVQLPFLRPKTTPSAFRSANASLVRMEIRLRSISATSPKAKQRILLLDTVAMDEQYP